MVTEVVYVKQEVPAALLECAPHPAPPVVTSQRDVAHYLVDLDAAAEDCRQRLAEVRRLVTHE